MFTKMSWSTYVEILVIGLMVYYLIILLLFYRKETSALLSKKKTPALVTAGEASHIPDTDRQLYQGLTDELTAYFQQARFMDLEREQLVLSLRDMLDKYPFQRNTTTGASVLEFVAEAAETYCSIHLSELELMRVMQ